MNAESTLWMGGIEQWMDELFIMKSFMRCGYKPKSIKFVKDKKLNKLQNFCFVSFNSFKEANSALFKLNATIIPQTNIFFKLNISKFSQKFSKNVYVGNLTHKINDIELYKIFKSKYPSVYYASIITDNGKSRGYGLVHFSKEDEYKKCLKEMNGIFIDNRIIRVKEKNNDDQKEYKNNYIKKRKVKSKIEEDNYSSSYSDYEETNVSSIGKEDIFFYDSKIPKNKTFLENLELLKNNDTETLNTKIQKNVDKLYNYYKHIKNVNEISKILLYYTSNFVEEKNKE